MSRLIPRILILFLVAGPRVTDVSKAQAWPQPPGHAYVKFSLGTSSAADQFDAGGAKKSYDRDVSGNAFLDRSFYLYAEYGLIERLTVIGQTALKRIHVRTDTGSLATRGFGNVSFGVRYGFMSPERIQQTGRSVAALFFVDLPTGYTRNQTPALGGGQTNLQFGLSAGQSLYPFPGYIQANLSYRVRTASYGLSSVTDCPRRTKKACIPDQQPDYGDEWVFLAEAGFTIGDRVLIQGILHGIWSNEEPVETFDPRNPLPTRQRLLKTGVGMTFYPGFGLGVGIQGFSTPTGRNTIVSNDWFFSVEYTY